MSDRRQAVTPDIAARLEKVRAAMRANPPGAGTLAAQIECVRRELGMRRRVYPMRVVTGRMLEMEAVREVASMEAVLATLERMAAGGHQAELPMGGGA